MPGNITPLREILVHAALAGNAGNTFPGPFYSPPQPMHILLSFQGGWNGGAITITGTDQFDAVLVETVGVVVTGTDVTVESRYPFKTITGIVKGAVGAAADTVTLRTGWPTKQPGLKTGQIGDARYDRMGVVDALEISSSGLLLTGAMVTGAVEIVPIFWEDGRWWPLGEVPFSVDTTMPGKANSRQYEIDPAKHFYHLWQLPSGLGPGVAEQFNLRGFSLNRPT